MRISREDEAKARSLAMQGWLRLRETNPEYAREYPVAIKYIEEWWEERYLPIVKRG